ncbi:MAG: hypothetical protein EOM20_04100 [Spartobacteria bacterium]|nr:hypothetical protein [Spartobacteria bacterium]
MLRKGLVASLVVCMLASVCFALVETDNPLLGVLKQEKFNVVQDLGIIHVQKLGLPTLEIRDGADNSAYEVSSRLNTMLFSGTHARQLERFVRERGGVWDGLTLEADPEARFLIVRWQMPTSRDAEVYRQQLNDWRSKIAALNKTVYDTLEAWGPDPKLPKVMPTPFNLATKWTIAGIGEFNPTRTGKEVLITDSTGSLNLLYFDSTGNLHWSADTNDLCWTSYTLGTTYSTNNSTWTIDAIGDINADGMDELIMRCNDTFSQGGKTKSYIRVLFFDDSGSGQIAASQPAAFAISTSWTIVGLGHFNTTAVGGIDSNAKQICLQHGTDGGFCLVYLNNNGTLFWSADTNNVCWTSYSSGSMYATNAPDWTVAAIGDVNGDGQNELIMRSSTTFQQGGKTKSQVKTLFFTDNGTGKLKGTQPAVFNMATLWTIEGMGNFNTAAVGATSTNAQQILIRHANDGGFYLLYMSDNGSLYWNADTNNVCWTSYSPGSMYATNAPDWTVAAIGDINGDQQDEILVNLRNTYREGGKTKFQNNILFFTTNRTGKLRSTQPAAF